MDARELEILEYVVKRINHEEAEFNTNESQDMANKEIGLCIEGLIEKGILKAKNNNWVVRGGNGINKYHSNIQYINYDNLKLNEITINYINYEKKSKFGKLLFYLKGGCKNFAKDFYAEARSSLIKWIVGLIGFVLFSLIGNKIMENIKSLLS